MKAAEILLLWTVICWKVIKMVTPSLHPSPPNAIKMVFGIQNVTGRDQRQVRLEAEVWGAILYMIILPHDCIDFSMQGTSDHISIILWYVHCYYAQSGTCWEMNLP